ncbi:MAG: 30S ribosomal protein S17 [Patescibacteria group bacterium]
MQDQKKEKINKQFIGKVVSTKMAKTLVVSVERMVKHKVYGKQFRVTKRFKVHDEQGGHKVGETVTFVSCRPISKEKRWRVV